MSDQLLPNDPASADCETLRDLLPAYLIGATDAAETRLVETLLPDCPDVVNEASAVKGVANALLTGAPVVEPPPNLEAKLMAALAEEERPKPVAVARRPAWQWASRIAAVVALVLLVTSNLYWIQQTNQLRAREGAVLSLLQRERAALAALGAANPSRIELAATEAGDSNSVAVALLNPAETVGLLAVSNLPPLTEDRTYQLWLITGDAANSAGLFTVDAGGNGALVFEASAPLANFDALGISEEPAGGSEAPTSAPIAVGEI